MVRFELCMRMEKKCVHSCRCDGAEDSLKKEKVRHVLPILLGRPSEKLEHVALLKRMDHIYQAGNGQVAGCAY